MSKPKPKKRVWKRRVWLVGSLRQPSWFGGFTRAWYSRHLARQFASEMPGQNHTYPATLAVEERG